MNGVFVARTLLGVLVVVVPALHGCSGGGGGGTGGAESGPATYTVGGTLSGVAGSLVLTNNGGDDLALTSDGSFTFATELADGRAYSVAVKTHPAGLTCLVSGGAGVVNGADVDSVAVACGAPASLDPGFGAGGTVRTPIGTGDAFASDVKIQADGKIVVAGYAYAGATADFAVARYNPDGSLDASFDGDGIVTTAIGTGMDVALAVALYGGGRIVVAGYYTSGDGDEMAVVRYAADGSLDTTFHDDGIATTRFLGTITGRATDVAVQPDGKIVVVGHFMSSGGDYDVAIVRYNADGTLDASFGGGDGGLLARVATGTNDYAQAVALAADGDIVVAGYSSAGGADDVAVLRFNALGVADAGFGGGDGKLTTPIGAGHDRAFDLALQGVGAAAKIVVAGSSNNGSNDDLALVRYNANGTLDTTFSGDGIVTTPVGSAGDRAQGMALGSFGASQKIVVAGYADSDLAVARYELDGGLDASFDGDGKVTTDMAGGDYANAVALQGDKKIVVVGYSYEGGSGDAHFVLARYWP